MTEAIIFPILWIGKELSLDCYYNQGMTENPVASFDFIAPFSIQILTRPLDVGTDWHSWDEGEGFFSVPLGADEYGIRVHNIDDADLYRLVKAVSGWDGLVLLNLSENRNVTDKGLAYLSQLPKLRYLNLSSVSISNAGTNHISQLSQLEELDLSFCNRLNDVGLRPLKSLKRLRKLNLQGCIKVKNSGVRMIESKGLEIKK